MERLRPRLLLARDALVTCFNLTTPIRLEGSTTPMDGFHDRPAPRLNAE